MSFRESCVYRNHVAERSPGVADCSGSDEYTTEDGLLIVERLDVYVGIGSFQPLNIRWYLLKGCRVLDFGVIMYVVDGIGSGQIGDIDPREPLDT